mmetsp:Transcript_82834/g.237974  ORF Transcript_82834/g.237974 Transcript_82834/m.237974 type:complete len:221 (+) Transcript_82834:81-743(+)
MHHLRPRLSRERARSISSTNFARSTPSIKGANSQTGLMAWRSESSTVRRKSSNSSTVIPNWAMACRMKLQSVRSRCAAKRRARPLCLRANNTMSASARRSSDAYSRASASRSRAALTTSTSARSSIGSSLKAAPPLHLAASAPTALSARIASDANSTTRPSTAMACNTKSRSPRRPADAHLNATADRAVTWSIKALSARMCCGTDLMAASLERTASSTSS